MTSVRTEMMPTTDYHAAGKPSPAPAPAAIIRAGFDRLARYDTDAGSHNGHYHGFLLHQHRLPGRRRAILGLAGSKA